MRIGLAPRAIAAVAAGVALGDCVLLGGGLLLWTAHLHATLDADRSTDRMHHWLRCVGQGAVLLGLGAALAAHTLAVVLGALDGPYNTQPWLAAGILLLLGFVGTPALAPRALQHGLLLLALLALLAPTLAGIGWTPCVFAALAALCALGNGGYRLGPLARRLAEPGHLR